MSTQSATAAASDVVTVAGGVFGPGHLGELTQYLPFELADDVLEQTRTVRRRLRVLPSRVGVYFVLALALYPRLGYLRVWGKLASPSSWLCLGRAPQRTVSRDRPREGTRCTRSAA